MTRKPAPLSPRPPIDTPDKARAARTHIGMGQAELARLMRLGETGRQTVRRIEGGEGKRVPGPYQVALEALLSGWRP